MIPTDDARALVARTRAAQGLPERVEDPAVLARIAQLLGARRDDAGPKAGATTVSPTAPVQGGGRRGTA